jgi:uncharacterized protein (TIGR02145 family)
MKNLLFVIVFWCVLNLNAQNYQITFTGTGATTTVSTVKVENLTKSTSLIVNGNDILHLTTATGINSIEDNQSSELKIYPNPMTDNSTLEILPPVAGNAVITVLDITGKPVAQIQRYLEDYLQKFLLSGIKNGFYLINVNGNNYQYSGKLLSNGKSNGTLSIEKVNNSIQSVDEKVEKANSKGTHATVNMTYATGDRLKFTGISGNYSTVITDIPVADKTINFNFVACSDGDNNNYPVVAIGTQVWMAENLKTTKYGNGDLIGTTTPATKDLSGESAPEYQWAYNGIESNAVTYGRLYSWYAITDSRNVCPVGWHLPTDAQWITLTTYLGGESVAGGKLKETGTNHWINPNTGATNENGFTGIPGGNRIGNGAFGVIGRYGIWWSATEGTTDAWYAWYRFVYYDNSIAGRNYGNKHEGFSVRCLRD